FGHIPFAAALLLMPMIALLLSAQGPINALCMEYVNRGFKVNYGLGRGLGSLGYAVASYLLGNAAQRFGVSVIPMTYTVLFFTTALLALSFRLPRAAQSEPSAGEHPDPRPQPARSITGVLTHYLLGCVFLMMCSNSISTYMINIMTARNAASSAMGTALSLGALLELPAMAVFTLLMKRFSTCTLLRFSSVFLTAKAIAICLSTTANGIFAAQMLQPLGYALFIPATVYYTNEALAPEDRMLGQTLMMAANTLASVFGSLGGGFLLDISGTSALLFVCVGISIAGTAFTFAAGRGSTSD
ncbi:MAG: MFS transporter, partial [Ruthenibacterium sp.]